jgi:hypothetical protein
MPTLPTDVRLAYQENTTPGTLYYECKRYGRQTKTYRKITRHLHRCAASSRSARPAAETPKRRSLDEEDRRP